MAEEKEQTTPPAKAALSRPLPAIPEQLVVGAAVAFVLALADLIYAYFLAEGTPETGIGIGLLVGLHLVALYLPLGLGLGLAFGILLAAARKAPALGSLRTFLTQPRVWFREDPRATATLLAFAAGALATSFAGRLAFELLTTRVHRAELATLAMGGIAPLLVLLFGLVVLVLRPLLAASLRLIGSLASPGAVISAGGLAGLFVGLRWLQSQQEILDAYGPSRLAWGPLAALLYLIAAIAVRRGLRRSRASLVAVAALTLLALAAPVLSALTYQGNRMRAVLEPQTVLGRLLVRGYASFTDLDGDGYTWAFGGEDCDDLNPAVHPGASDPAGDGVDGDCYAGDGTPEVADLGDGRYGRRPPGLPERPNILVVTIDALRADHLGAYGYGRPTSPNIDAFAQDAVRFATVVAPSSRSLRSIPSMWIGEYPSQIAFGPEVLYPALLQENQTAAELLGGARGYQTAAVMDTRYFARVRGFFQGFTEVHQAESMFEPQRGESTERGIEEMRRLAGGEQPWLLWVHLFNVHAPYLPDRVRSRFGTGRMDAYDTEISMADHEFHRLLEALDQLGLRERTVVVLASDHGEAFGEHGQYHHCTTLYEEELRSTLLIRAPGIGPRVVEGPVGLMDLAPTLLNLVGLALPRPIPGRSLLPMMTGEREVDRSRNLFAELVPDGIFPYDLKIIRQGDDKLIWWLREGRYQLFDLATDPVEQVDLSDTEPARARELLGTLRAWVAQTNRSGSSAEAFIASHRLAQPPSNMSHRLNLLYPGFFTLLGFDLPRTRFHPGESIPLTFYYRVDHETQLDLQFRVDVRGPANFVVPMDFHGWHYPLQSSYPTPRWRRGEILRDPSPIVIPPGVDTPVRLRLTLTVLPRDSGGPIHYRRDGQSGQELTLAEIEITE